MPAAGAAVLQARLERLPRLPLVTGPTPLQEAPRLSAALGGPRILIKRDDLTGLMFGGNKVRQMEFVLGAALAEGADVFIRFNEGLSILKKVVAVETGSSKSLELPEEKKFMNLVSSDSYMAMVTGSPAAATCGSRGRRSWRQAG